MSDTLDLMRTRFKMAISAFSESREDQIDDVRFYAGSPDNSWQWPADVLATRGAVQGQTINARPTLTLNKLPQHVRQVTNDQRQHRPSGKIIPANDDADVEVAEILDGIVRHIEYMSDADVAYDTACENQVSQGEGYFMLDTEYCDDGSFDQDIRIRRIRNAFSVYMDPTMQDPCGADAEWCFITQDVLKEDFERQFPDATPISSIMSGVGDQDVTPWIMEDTVRIAEYYYIKHEKATLNLYHGGITAMQGSPEAKQAEIAGLRPIKSRKVDKRSVKWLKTNGYEELEPEKDWAGRWIPVIRVIGNEFEVEGRLYISGLVRNAKDAQRMYNYWVSQEAEMLALAPKAPFIGYGGQFEGYEQWKTANTTNWPYLEVNPDVTDGQGSVLPLPQRAMPPMAQQGIIAAKMGAADDIKATTGQYDTSLGATSNERSGKAILARERQSDTGTYHYVDNLARAIRYCTRQIVDLIPKIYDTARVARIVGIDGTTVDSVKIDPQQEAPVREIKDEQGITIEKIYNPSVGRYDVCVTTGPNYMTKRQEALEGMAQLLQGNPELWAVAGDLFVKHMDWPGAEEMSDRIKKTIKPELLADEDDPALAAAQKQIQQMGGELDQLHKMLQNVNQSLEAKTLQNEHFKADISAFEAETKRLTAIAGASVTPQTATVNPEMDEVLKQYVREILAKPAPDTEEDAVVAGERQMEQPQ